MDRWPVSILILAGVAYWPSTALAQADQCRGAFSVLNRVKEQITPDLKKDAGKELLRTMQSSLETATNVCKNEGELWYYRSIVSERLGIRDSYSEMRYRELGFKPEFNPFTPPEATQPPPEKETPVGGVHKKWALVVGIGQFQDPTLNALNFAAKDSDDFVQFLQDPNGGRFPPERIKHLVNNQATLRGIREGIGWLRANVQPEDLVVIYFSSHGSPRDQDPNGVSYIMAYDTTPSGASLYATSLQMIDLVQAVNRELKARRVVLILDTCFSGDAAQGHEARPMWTAGQVSDESAAGSFSGALANLKIGYGRAVLTATRADEESWEGSRPDWKGGYFTHFLIAALSATQGQGPLGAVFPKVQQQVASEVKQDLGRKQNPSCDFSESADSIVIGVPESN